MTPVEDRVAADITEHGWHVVLVSSSSTAPELAYTVGLVDTFGHPEIAVLGLPSTKAYALLNEAGAAIKKGTRFDHGERPTDLLVGCEVAFIKLSESQCRRNLSVAKKYYGGDGFEAVQLVWPDLHGRFPWDAGVLDHTRVSQEVAS